MHCLRQIDSERGTNDPSDPAHELALRILIVMLKDDSFSEAYPLVPRCRPTVTTPFSRQPRPPSTSVRLASARSLRLTHPRQPPLKWIDPDTA